MPTEIGLDQTDGWKNGARSAAGREAAAIEVIDRYLRDAPGNAVALLFEDPDVSVGVR